jgi:hypothetical protein
MHKLLTTRTISGATFAALFVATLAMWLPTPDGAKAQTLALDASHRALKADRLPDLLKGPACSALGWPHYEQRCLVDVRRAADDIPNVRIIALR